MKKFFGFLETRGGSSCIDLKPPYPPYYGIPGDVIPSVVRAEVFMSQRVRKFDLFSSFLFFSKDKRKEKSKIAAKSREKKKIKQSLPIMFRRFSIKEQVHFAKRMAFLVSSGVSLLDSLHIIRKQTPSKFKGKIIDVIIDDVSNGRTLSSGLARFPESFGVFAINVIKVGEMSGTLTQNLKYLAVELQKKQVLKRKIVGALVYPIFITLATIGISVLLTVYIFPKIMPIFISLNVKLPITTKILLWMSEFLRNWGLYLLGGIIVLIIAFFFTINKNKQFHYFISRFILRLPLFGRLVQSYNMANLCRTMSLLLRSGFTAVDAARVTGESTANPVYSNECQKLGTCIIRGDKISKHLEKSCKLFPDIVCHMVTIGEASGTLSDTLMYLSEHYEEEVDDVVKNLSSTIEPVLMVVMGVIVGFVAVSVITPIYDITSSLQR